MTSLMSREEILDELEIIYNKLLELTDYTDFDAKMDIYEILKQNKREL